MKPSNKQETEMKENAGTQTGFLQKFRGGRKMAQVSMKGAIDMHVHTNPDLRTRKYDDLELCDAAVRVGARAIVIKSHLGSTVERAALVNHYNKIVHGDNDFTMFGGIVMNRSVGGINPEAVSNALKLGGKVVWLPTQSARNHLEKLGKPTDGCVDVVKNGEVVPELYKIFDLVNQYDAVLATAHVSAEEAFIVTKAAREAGVKKIVITHPEWFIVNMTVEQQIDIVKKYDVILERCYAQNKGVGAGHGYISNLPGNLEIIRTVGYKNVLISTDGGQVENPNWEIADQQYQQYMVDHGIPEDQVRYMSHDLPAMLLGIE